MLNHWLRYYRYAKTYHNDSYTGGKLYWSLREVYWDYFPSRFDAWCKRHPDLFKEES